VQRWEVAAGLEFRSLPHAGAGNRDSSPVANGPWSVDFRHDNRVLASAGSDGVRLWDVVTGKPLAELTVGHSDSALFLPDGSLLTHAGARLQRWPIVAEEVGKQVRLTIGPPVLAPVPAKSSLTAGRLALDRSGRLLALAQRGEGQAVVGGTGELDKAPVLNIPNVSDIALSPDGRWAATGSWGGREIAVWDVGGRRVERRLASADGYVAFSPDGRQLIAGLPDRFEFWRVGAWDRPTRVLPRPLGMLRGYVAYAPDGRLVALARTSRDVLLIGPESANPVATLHAPQDLLISGLCFSPAGDRLAVATENHIVQIWDLRAIRRQLAAMGLDWELPPYSPTAPTDSKPILVEVHSRTAGDRTVARVGPDRAVIARLTDRIARKPSDAALLVERGLLHARGGDWSEAISDYSEAYRLDPQPRLLETRGWLKYRIGRDSDAIVDWRASLKGDPRDPWFLYRDATLHLEVGDFERYRTNCQTLLDLSETSADPYAAERAAKICLLQPKVIADGQRLLRLADRALATDAALGWFLLTKGIAHYRLGEHDRSLEWLKRGLEADRGLDASARSLAYAFVAMNHVKQGRPSEARRSLEAADRVIAESVEAIINDGSWASWHDLIIFRVAHREASGLSARALASPRSLK
jgi:tetratricopeptide (TPR) repeat protein